MQPPGDRLDALEHRRLHAELQDRMFGRKMPVCVGRYRLGARLGAGAMGIVYRAHDSRLRRDVALKVLHPVGLREDVDRGHRRLRREARSLARVVHPNVVQVFDVGVDAGRVFIAMELVDGASLGAWLLAEPRAASEVLGVFVQAGRGLAAAHAAGVVHRDFKPANVLVGHNGMARVGDFGLATTLRSPSQLSSRPLATDDMVTADGAIAGTPRYMAPAQRGGAPADTGSDQFSFCVALRESLSSPGVRGSIPRGVGAAIAHGLEEDPARRFDSMQALVDALERPRRRRRWSALAAATVAVGFGAPVDVPLEKLLKAAKGWELMDGKRITAGERKSVHKQVAQLKAAMSPPQHKKAKLHLSRLGMLAPVQEIGKGQTGRGVGDMTQFNRALFGSTAVIAGGGAAALGVFVMAQSEAMVLVYYSGVALGVLGAGGLLLGVVLFAAFANEKFGIVDFGNLYDGIEGWAARMAFQIIH